MVSKLVVTLLVVVGAAFGLPVEQAETVRPCRRHPPLLHSDSFF